MSIISEPQKKPTTDYSQSALQQDSEKLRLCNDLSHAPLAAGYGRQTAVLTPTEQLEKEIAKRKKTEEALQEERNLAQKIMTTMGQGLMLADIDGVLEYVNPQCAEMLGYETADLIGKTPLDFVHPDDQATLIEAKNNCLTGMATRYEYRVVRADGSFLYVLVSGVPHYDHQGKLIGSIATITDLTERRKAEAKIEANAEEIKMIYKAAIQLFKPGSVKKLAEQIAAITRDELGFDACRVLLLQEPIKLNTDRLTLKSQNTANYLTCLARLGSICDSGTTVPLMDDGLVATAVRQAEIIYAPDLSQDSSHLPNNTFAQSELVVPLRAYNTIIGAIDLQSPRKNGFDERAQRIITVFAEHAGLALETMRLYEELYKHSNELNALNAKLAKALRTKDEFLANMSHELRTPLSAILGKSELMLEGILGPLTDKQSASLRVVEESGRHLLDLINDILDIAKIEAGKIALDIQQIPLQKVNEISLHVVRQMAHKKQIKLQVNVPPSLKSCRADERRLKQILINLLSNAVKFTANGGEVGLNISDDPEKEVIQFQVWDTGIGISPENMKLLFKPFVQLDSSLARSHEGTGLGLSLVYHLTEMHGGSVSLESQVGVGSCFTVTLPKNPRPDSARLQEQAKMDRLQYGALQISQQAKGSSEPPLIFLVEDNEMSIESMVAYLPVWGYRLIVARTGHEAVARAQQEKPDLILMDYQIPEVDGVTAVAALRQDPTTRSTPIVALTALVRHGDQERCLAAGFNKCFNKPIHLRQLAQLIDQLLTEAYLKQAHEPEVKPTHV